MLTRWTVQAEDKHFDWRVQTPNKTKKKEMIVRYAHNETANNSKDW